MAGNAQATAEMVDVRGSQGALPKHEPARTAGSTRPEQRLEIGDYIGEKVFILFLFFSFVLPGFLFSFPLSFRVAS